MGDLADLRLAVLLAAVVVPEGLPDGDGAFVDLLVLGQFVLPLAVRIEDPGDGLEPQAVDVMQLVGGAVPSHIDPVGRGDDEDLIGLVFEHVVAVLIDKGGQPVEEDLHRFGHLRPLQRDAEDQQVASADVLENPVDVIHHGTFAGDLAFVGRFAVLDDGQFVEDIQLDDVGRQAHCPVCNAISDHIGIAGIVCGLCYHDNVAQPTT